MNAKILLIGMFLLITGFSYSQDNTERKERNARLDKRELKETLESRKIAMITSELNLSTEEAQKFWPVYNTFQDELDKLRKESRTEKKKWEFMSDEDAEAMLQNRLDFEQNELDLRRKYYKELQNTISPKKVAKLVMAERKFKERMLKSLKHKLEKRDRKDRGERN